MKPQKQAKSVYVIVRDHDRKVFSVHGPMSDDAMIAPLVHAAQDAGRVMDYSSTTTSNIENVTKKAARDSGYAEVSSALNAD